MPTLLAMFGTTDLIIIGVVMLLLFGTRLPKVMRSLGEGIQEFKEGMNHVPRDDDDRPRKRIDDTPPQEAH